MFNKNNNLKQEIEKKDKNKFYQKILSKRR